MQNKGLFSKNVFQVAFCREGKVHLSLILDV